MNHYPAWCMRLPSSCFPDTMSAVCIIFLHGIILNWGIIQNDMSIFNWFWNRIVSYSGRICCTKFVAEFYFRVRSVQGRCRNLLVSCLWSIDVVWLCSCFQWIWQCLTSVPVFSESDVVWQCPIYQKKKTNMKYRQEKFVRIIWIESPTNQDLKNKFVVHQYFVCLWKDNLLGAK